MKFGRVPVPIRMDQCDMSKCLYRNHSWFSLQTDFYRPVDWLWVANIATYKTWSSTSSYHSDSTEIWKRPYIDGSTWYELIRSRKGEPAAINTILTDIIIRSFLVQKKIWKKKSDLTPKNRIKLARELIFSTDQTSKRTTSKIATSAQRNLTV